ncbi:Alpha-aminoadipic semialdehyde synthase-like protein [Drosera capensis]
MSEVAEVTMLGNGVVGVLAETCNKWERRAPLTPSHCARLLHSGKAGVSRIIVQPSTKRVYHDSLYEDVGCEISEDLSECGLIVGVKQPRLEMILPDRAYSFFSHTHKAQKENMPLLDKILEERATLYDYELIVGDHGKRMLAFGTYAGRAGMIDFLRGLGERYLSIGYSTAFLSLGASYMYPSLAAAKAAVISVGEEIATLGLPSGICPLVFIFTGSGNVSQGAQEIFKLLPHSFVEPRKLPELFEAARGLSPSSRTAKRTFQVYGCVVTSQDMVEPNDPSKTFNKVDYYSHPEHYSSIFHERIAPYASVIVNCMYWEHRFPRLLTNSQLRDLMARGCRLVGISDITCDVGGSIEFVNQTTPIDFPFFRYDPLSETYHFDMDGNGVICSAVDNLPTEFAKEASQHFGNILSKFIGHLASAKDVKELPSHLRRACITHKGSLTSLYEYIPRMRKSSTIELSEDAPSSTAEKKKHTVLVSLTGHLFDKFLINEALDIIEAAGGSFHLVKCQVGQSTDDPSFSEVEVGADDRAVLDQIIDSLTSLANKKGNQGSATSVMNEIVVHVGLVHENGTENGVEARRKAAVLILGAGRVCRPAAELLASVTSISSWEWSQTSDQVESDEANEVEVIVASLFLKDAEEVIQGIPNARAIQLDVSDVGSLHKHVSEVDVVISLLPASCHSSVANACIEVLSPFSVVVTCENRLKV